MLKAVAVLGLLFLGFTVAAASGVSGPGEGAVVRSASSGAGGQADPNPSGVHERRAAGTIWDGVYSTAQAERGAAIYGRACARCHGRNGNGAGEPDMPESPSVARAAFITRWNGKTVGQLYTMVKTTMPQDNKGSLSDQEFIDVVAHMLSLSMAPAGPNDLTTDAAVLTGITIAPRPAAAN